MDRCACREFSSPQIERAIQEREEELATKQSWLEVRAEDLLLCVDEVNQVVADIERLEEEIRWFRWLRFGQPSRYNHCLSCPFNYVDRVRKAG